MSALLRARRVGALPRSSISIRRQRFSTASATAAADAPLSRFSGEKSTSVAGVFSRLKKNIATVRGRLGRPLTLSEKLVLGHSDDAQRQELDRGKSFLKLRPVRVAMQDASAQMAMLQFMSTGLEQSKVPATVHCDHLIQAQHGADADLKASTESNAEIFDFLESSSRRYGIGFWGPGSGIIHQVVLENYAFPGGLMIGTDSHTPNGGGLGMIAVGVGGVDAAETMAGLPWELQYPKCTGVRLTGRLQKWTSPKDIILHLAGLLTVQGGTGHIVEYFGEGVDSLSCTGQATICNMGAEIGATTSVFPYTAAMGRYLRATQRSGIASICEEHSDLLKADADAEKHYDRVLEIDLDKLQPYINGPFSPDRAHALHDMRAAVTENKWPDEIAVGLIGSCTNSSYEDMTRAAHIVRQGLERGLKFKSAFLVTPGTERIRATMERDGLTDVFTKAGATVLANACGPCIGQWKRTDPSGIPSSDGAKAGANSILASYNRNFTSRNDGNAATHNFLSSPDVVTALAFAGRLSFNPATDSLKDSQGQEFMLQPPQGDELPSRGFAGREHANASFLDGPDGPDASASGASTAVVVDPNSSRLQLLDPFPAWDGEDIVDAPVLVKAKGKCTTDHISAAGPWLKYKGHLENIAENTLIGAINADTGETNVVRSQLDGSKGSIPEVAKQYKKAGVRWVVIADSNYGEGSAREHAAMQPRFLGGVAVLCRSFARIHETNLKKQGMLPLTFADPNDYDRVSGDDKISVLGLKDLAPGQAVTVRVRKSGGEQFDIEARHTFSREQLTWFAAGSALNAAAKA